MDFNPSLRAVHRRRYKSAHRIILINFAGPYVTSVGGTIRIPEVATIYSGGGFSSHFPALDYQKDKANAYIGSLGDKYYGRYACVRSCGSA